MIADERGYSSHREFCIDRSVIGCHIFIDRVRNGSKRNRIRECDRGRSLITRIINGVCE